LANIKTLIHAEIDPRNPVPEILTVIRSVTPFHPGQEEAILIGLMEAMEQRLIVLKKGAAKNAEQISEPGRNPADPGEL
jgi:hypothetical protein